MSQLVCLQNPCTKPIPIHPHLTPLFRLQLFHLFLSPTFSRTRSFEQSRQPRRSVSVFSNPVLLTSPLSALFSLSFTLVWLHSTSETSNIAAIFMNCKKNRPPQLQTSELIPNIKQGQGINHYVHHRRWTEVMFSPLSVYLSV